MGMDPTHLSSGILEIKPLFVFTSACAIVPYSTVVCHDWKKALLALRAIIQNYKLGGLNQQNFTVLVHWPRGRKSS